MKKLLLAILIVLPLISGAQGFDYTPLAPIPQITEGSDTVNVSEFIPRAITLGIGIAGALSVIFIMIGGIQYMTTDAYSGKSDGAQTIRNAIFGLLLAIGSYAILYTIDRDLVRLDLNIRGVTQGGAIDPNSVSTTTRPFGTQSAIDVGCTNNCIALLNQVPSKGPRLACKTDICYLNAELIEKFENVNRALDGIAPWQITEAYPPTVTHRDGCHMDVNTRLAGTCADVALRNIVLNNESIPIIRRFIGEMVSQGLVVDYETTNVDRYNQIRDSSEIGIYRGMIKLNTAATAEHAHVELPYE